MEDFYGRKIDYLRISITEKCNLRCRYCMAEDQKFAVEELSIDDYIKLARPMIKKGIKKIRITGGEPLLKKDLPILIKAFKKEGIEDISITTNGILLDKYAEELREAGLTRINISLDSLNEDKYRYITRGGDLSKVLNAIKICKDLKFDAIKINVVLLKNFNLDEFQDFLDFSDMEDLIVRFIELMPIGEAIKFKDQLVSNAELIKSNKDLKKYTGNKETGPAEYYYRDNKKSLIGFISPLSCNFCQSCNRIRIDHNANLITCLHSSKLVSLKDQINNEKELIELLDKSIIEKPKRHEILEGHTIKRNMNTIGG